MQAPFSRTLFDLLRERSEKDPEAVAVIGNGRQVRYFELYTTARRLAGALRARGIGRGDRVGLLISNRIEWLEACFAVGAAGATLVPLSTWSTKPELTFLLADSGVKIVIALARFGDRDYAADFAEIAPEIAEGHASRVFPNLSEIVLVAAEAHDRFGRYEDLASEEGVDDLPPGLAASASDDGLVLYTSGPSANPKAVRLRQFGIVENGFNIGERMGLRPADRVLLSAPLFWSYGSANALPATLTHGGTLVLQEKFGSAESIDLIERHGCTALYTLPGMTTSILNDSGFSADRVRTLRTGLTIGAPQDFLTAARGLGADELCNIYGATETYGNCCVTWHHWPMEKRASCQGPPLPGNEIRFVDPNTGNPVPPGEPGLLEIRGYVTPGYSGASADQNQIAFTPDGYYRTGDVGRLDEDGAFVFIGRNTEMIKRAGINVSPAEVENILLRHPGVTQAGVVGVADRERGELVIAYVVANDLGLTAESLIAHCKSIASKYKVPDRIEIRPALPQTPTGKLQRRELKRDAADLVSGGPARG